MKAKDIILKLDELCNPMLVDSWDNTGFQIGNDEYDISKILLALDLDEEVLNKAIDENYNMIVTHHPIIFKPMKSITSKSFIGKMALKLIENHIVVYNAHSNLDMATGGVNDELADSLEMKNLRPLNTVKKPKYYKFNVYVPEEYSEKIINALAEVDAGHIGNYSTCTFSTKGLGTFKPLSGTNPFIGSEGSLEKVKEVKIETVVREENLSITIDKVIENHPYEEVAYDIFELNVDGKKYGYGRVGDIDPINGLDFIKKLKEKLNVNDIRVYGDLDKTISKVAVCGGSGGDLVTDAYYSGAEIYITGDIKYHDAQTALQYGLVLIDAGHFHTEKLVLNVLKRYLDSSIKDEVQTDIYLDSNVVYKIY